MRALLSVYDKTGIVEFGHDLTALGWELVSTGGTYSTLHEAGIPVISVAEVTGFPEILDGRVKTLHPKVHAGLLARTELNEHRDALSNHEITAIDLLACNLYPFESTISKQNVAEIDAIENIDIGGPAMVRAAAKNFANVIVLTDPSDYTPTLEHLRAGGVAPEERRRMAAQAFAHVAAYDSLVADYLRGPTGREPEWPKELSIAGRLVQPLRYGENPQQRGAAYRRISAASQPAGILDATQLGGKELSYNNLLDADCAWSAVARYAQPTVSIVKHTIPCGLAARPELHAAFLAALDGDPVSAFGGIVASNRELDGPTAAKIAETFFEVIVAPGFSDDALNLLSKKKTLRLLSMPHPLDDRPDCVVDIRPIRGGLLVQTKDEERDDPAVWRTVTRRVASERERADLEFAWEAARHVKSNAIVLVSDSAIVGVGAGQPNRVESVRIATGKAGPKSAGAVMASDAFFPFADGIEHALAAGVTAVIQPGGSVRDAGVIAAADAAGAAMMFTGVRHFKH